MGGYAQELATRLRKRRLYANNTGAVLSARQALTAALSRDGATVADYQPGNYTGTLNASAWANSIGAAGSLLQATGANQPTIEADGSLLFDGLAHWMRATFTLNQPETIYLVGKQVTWTDQDQFYDGVTADSMDLYQGTVTPTIKIYAGAAAAVSTQLAVDTYGVIVAVFNGASSTIKVDGNAPGTAVDVGAGNGGGITLGAKATPLNYGNVQIKEVIIRNVADSAAVQAQIQALLKAIHGTP